VAAPDTELEQAFGALGGNGKPVAGDFDPLSTAAIIAEATKRVPRLKPEDLEMGLDAWAETLGGQSQEEIAHSIAETVDLITPVCDDPVGAVKAALERAGLLPEEQKGPTPRLVRMCDVKAEMISWLWPRRVPLGKYTLLMGDPGLLKSTLSLYMAAKVSTGGTWPDEVSLACEGCAPLGDVVLLTAEDGLADTVRPRLDLLGADLKRVWVLQAVRDESKDGERSFNLLRDVALLERVVVDKHAVLVVIDPLNAYIAGTDSHNAAEVRQAISPVAAMAERTGAAVVCIHHLNKADASVNALYRASGSLDFVAAARSVLGVAPDPDEKDRVLLLPVKLNIAAKPEGIGFRRDDTGLVFDGQPVNLNANDAFTASKARAESPQMAEAKELLLRMLDGGEVVPCRLVQEEAKVQGVADETLKRAKTKLGVRSTQRFDAAAGKSAWYWHLEAKE
jgi:putative DNA primase/helicase